MSMGMSFFLRATILGVIAIVDLVSSSVLAVNKDSSEVFVAKAQAGPQGVRLFLNRSLVIKLPAGMKRMSIANPDLADTLILNSRELYLTGKKCGATNLVIWGGDKNILAVLDLDISIDITRLQERLNQLIGAGRVEALADQDTITLSGSVEDQQAMAKVLTLAEAYSPKKVNNFLAIGRAHRDNGSGDALINVEVIRGVAVETVTTREGK